MATVRFCRREQVVRLDVGGQRPRTSNCPTGRSPSSSARPAAASRRRCACSPAWNPSRSGTITIGERDVTALQPRDRDVAMVFQNYALYPHLTVRENIAFPLRATKQPRAERAQAGRRDRRIPGSGKAVGAQAEGPQRRPAAARRDRQGDHPATVGLPVRRTAEQPRRQTAGRDQDRTAADSAQARHHLPVRHARPGRGDDAVGPHGGDA